MGAFIAFGWRDHQTPLSGAGTDSVFTTWAKNRAYSTIPAAEDRAASRLTLENANGWYGIFAEPVQGLALYQTQTPMRPTQTRRTVVLQPLGDLRPEEKAILVDCKRYCEAFSGLPTRIASPLPLDVSQFLPRIAKTGASKIQLNSGQLLEHALRPKLPDDAAAHLGVTSHDLWTEGLSFVFGQATFHERVGVYSLTRYFPKDRTPKSAENERKKERKLALRRTAQVLTHETGHMFGLFHCVLYRCNMNGSNSLSDSDRSPLDFCPVCARKLAWNIGYDRAARDAKLAKVKARFGLGIGSGN